MATTLTTTTFGTTYRDDYTDSDNYHRILFNAGKALQARELTQMQTITQEELARFGRNIFVDGAPVRGGSIHIVRFKSLKLDTSTYNLPSNLNWSDLIGKEFTGTSPAIKFKILRAYGPSAKTDGSGTYPATLVYEFTDTTAGTSGTSPVSVAAGATFTNTELSLTLQAAASSPNGIATYAGITDGDFFVKGHFVFAKQQSILLDKYQAAVTMDIGFKIVEEVVTVADTTALYDNQGENPNEASPGADRYRISLQFVRKPDITVNDNFVYLATIISGEISRQVTKVDGYNTIYDLMATRTKEESGNYSINNFTAKFNDISTNDSSLDLEISGGVAYVDGYRLEMPPSKIQIPKARSTLIQNNQAIVVQYGNYIVGDDTTNAGMPDIHQLAQVNLRSATSHGGSTIGTARVRAIEEDNSGNTRYYLFDIQMNAGQNFRDTRSFGTSATDYVDVVLEDGIAALKSTANNSLLFDLPSQRPTLTGVSDISMTVQVRYSLTYTGTAVTLTAPGTDDVFTNTGDWKIASTTGAMTTATFTLTGSPTGNQVQVSSIAAGNGTYELITYVALDGANIAIRQKTLEAAQSITAAWPGDAITDANGNQYIDLGYADVYELQRLRTVDSDGEDLIANFTFDNGQRDNFYAKSRLIAKPGVTIPTGNIYAKFRRFSHGTGDFFAANSYNGAVSYENIPNHTKSNGQLINLRDVLDFRPVQATDGTYTGTGGIINALPQNTDVIRADVEYYLPRKDKLAITIQKVDRSAVKFGKFIHIPGTSALTPQAPSTPVNSLTLYNIDLQPYTLNKSDVKMSLVKTKNYTMRDIGELEKRIDNVVELTTLSLLENETATINVLDSAGNPRTKAGFLADNFSNYQFSDTLNPSYRASIDQGANELTPKFTENNTRLIYDADNAGNTVSKVGDYLILPYTEQVFVNNNAPTTVLNVNPGGFISNNGLIKLSPASDEWFETEYVPDVVIDKGDVTTTNGSVTANSRNDSRYSWYGDTSGDTLRVVTGTNTVRELVNEKVVEKKFIPYMRSIKVYFKARGLRANTQHFPFFNGTLISDWARAETTFVNYSDTSTDYGTTLNASSGHPDGSSNLISDANGEIIGSFVIPATEALKFRCGDVIFKLLDISANSDTSSTSSAFEVFTSTGIINITERTFESTRHVTLAAATIAKVTSTSSGVSLGGSGGDTIRTGSAGWHNYNGGFFTDDKGNITDYGGVDWDSPEYGGAGGTVSNDAPFGGPGGYGAGQPAPSYNPEFDDGDTGDTGGDSKIVCTAMNDAYGFGSFRQKIWLAQSRDLPQEYQLGYHTLFRPLVKYAYHSDKVGYKFVRATLEHIARHRTADIWKQKHGKRDWIGAVERAVLEPMCYATGYIVKKLQDRK